MFEGLAQKAVSASAKRMGRPPLGNKATQVRLPQAIMDRIDALMGANRRAQFIREAVENELKRREQERE
jgi:hypothetical protein